MSEPSQARPRLLGEAAILAAFSGLSYMLAFRYETGYASHFGVPDTLITVDLRSLLFFATLLGSAGIIVLFLFNHLFMVFPRNMSPALRRSIIKMGFVWIWVLIPFALFGPERTDKWVYIFVFALFITAFEFLWPLFFERKVSGYATKLAAAQAKDDSLPDLFSLSNWTARNIVLLVWLVGGALLVAGWIGEAQAFRRREFLVWHTEPPRVVVRAYGDLLICAQLNRATREVLPVFVVVKEGDPSLELTLEDIGRLTRISVSKKPERTNYTGQEPPSRVPSPPN